MNRDPIGELGGLNLLGMLNNDTINESDLLGLASTAETTFFEAIAVGDWAAAEAILDAMAGIWSAEKIGILAGIIIAAQAAQGLIDQLDGHIAKLEDAGCPNCNYNPNDPDHDPWKGWIKEIKAAIQNIKNALKRLPKNKVKRKPLEDAIKRGEDFLNKCNIE